MRGRRGRRFDPGSSYVCRQLRYATHGLLRITFKKRSKRKHAFGMSEARASSLFSLSCRDIHRGGEEGYPGMHLSQPPRSGCIFVFLTFCCCIRDLKIHVLHFPKGVVQ